MPKQEWKKILILTGESRKYSDVAYIGEAVKIARKYFKNIGIEIYPVNVDEYTDIFMNAVWIM